MKINDDKETKLEEALAYTKQGTLPKAYNPETMPDWIYALALVSKVDGSKNYVVVQNNFLGKILVKKDFGNMASIAKYISIHPYLSMKTNIQSITKTSATLSKFLLMHGMTQEQIDQIMSKTKKDGTEYTEEEMNEKRAKTIGIVKQNVMMEEIYKYNEVRKSIIK